MFSDDLEWSDDDVRTVESASAVRLVFYLDVTDYDGTNDWELALIETICNTMDPAEPLECTNAWSNIQIFINTGRSVNDELQRNVTLDLPLIALTYVCAMRKRNS